jgi:quinoprotein glucose dehydrogenase
LRPAPFARQTVTEETLTTRTASAHEWAVKSFRQMRSNGQFVPLSVGNDTIVTPSFEGGAEWGGPALDPRTNVIYINANNYASIGALAAHSGSSPGRSTYLSQCSLCHGEHRTGSVPEFPSLLSVTDRFTPEEITKTIHQGRGRMPAFPNIQGDQLRRLLDYLHTEKDLAPPDTKASEEQTALSQQELKAPTRNTKTDAQTQGSADHSPDTQYAMTGYRRFLDPDGYPAVSTPWGTLNALDLNTGEYLWQIPLGQYPELVEAGMPDTGSENYGGPIVTAGGLLFIGATNFDKKFRAFDESTGGLLWETTLPFAGNATPASYEVDGRQYVVIAAGGSSMNPRGPTGGVYVAFALPRSSHTP